MNVIARLLGYNKKVEVIRKVKGGYRRIKDRGKYLRSEMNNDKFKLYNLDVTLPPPPAKAVLDGRIQIFEKEAGEYAYVEFHEGIEEMKTIETDMAHWMEQEIREGIRDYEDKSVWEQYFPIIGVAVIVITTGIFMVVTWQQVFSPMVKVGERMLAEGTTHTCEYVVEKGGEAAKNTTISQPSA